MTQQSEAYMEGWHAYHQGKCETSNPYEVTDEEHLDWNDGFAAAADEEDHAAD